jgi:hypothetical protein
METKQNAKFVYKYLILAKALNRSIHPALRLQLSGNLKSLVCFINNIQKLMRSNLVKIVSLSGEKKHNTKNLH